MSALFAVPDADAWLDRMRDEADPLADAAVAELIALGRIAPGGLQTAFRAAVGRGEPACAALARDAAEVPRWVSFPAMDDGARLGLRYPVQSALALLLGSLMESYASVGGARVLVRSGMLEHHTVKRLHDTAEFVFQIVSSRGAPPGTPAHEHVVKVRLVHGFVRHGMRRRTWERSWGAPVNQEDSASTLLMFCHVYLRAMDRLGVTVREREERSVHHMFRWIGKVMGVREELLTEDRAEERALYEAIKRRQFHVGADGRALARGLVSAMASRPPLFLPVPALEAITRRVLGDELADDFALRRSWPWERAASLIAAASRVQHVAHGLPFAKRVSERVGHSFARVMLERGLVA